jgi:hypothetical protein
MTLNERVNLTNEDLFSCRIAVSPSGKFAALFYQHTKYNSGRLTIHAILSDGRTLGAIGQRIPDGVITSAYSWTWDDSTDYVIR